MIVGACLAVTGLIVAQTPSRLLGTQAVRGDAPRLAVLGWFAGALTAVALWLAAAAHLLLDGDRFEQIMGATAGLALLGRLGWVVTCGLWRTRRQQRKHLATARIVGRRDVRPGVLIIDVSEPAVYCVPSGTGTVLMSRGAHDLLSEDQAQAVLAHERSHLHERHHMLITLATALDNAVPRLKLFGPIGSHVAVLLEMRADDAAIRAHGTDTVIDALAALCLRESPAGALAAHGPTVLQRVNRLTEPAPRWRSWVGVATTTVTVLVIGAVPILASWAPLCPHPLA